MSTEKRKERTDPETHRDDPEELDSWFQRQEEVDEKMEELGWKIPEKKEPSEEENSEPEA